MVVVWVSVVGVVGSWGALSYIRTHRKTLCYIVCMGLDRTVTIRVSGETWDRIVEIAEERDRRPTELARMVLERYTDERSPDTPVTGNGITAAALQHVGCDCTVHSPGVRRGMKSSFGLCPHGKKVFV